MPGPAFTNTMQPAPTRKSHECSDIQKNPVHSWRVVLFGKNQAGSGFTLRLSNSGSLCWWAGNERGFDEIDGIWKLLYFPSFCLSALLKLWCLCIEEPLQGWKTKRIDRLSSCGGLIKQPDTVRIIWESSNIPSCSHRLRFSSLQMKPWWEATAWTSHWNTCWCSRKDMDKRRAGELSPSSSRWEVATFPFSSSLFHLPSDRFSASPL